MEDRDQAKNRSWLVPAGVAAFYGGLVAATFAFADPSRAPRCLLWEEAAAGTEPAVSPGRGVALFEKYCSSCHGVSGDGRGPLAPFLSPPPRDFTRAIFKFRTNLDGNFPRDEDLFRSVSAGFPAHGMPVFDGFTSGDRWALVAEVKRFARSGFEARLAVEAKAGEIETSEVPAILEGAFRTGPPLEIPAADDPGPGALRRGAEVYVRLQCASCHGERGAGDGPSAADLRDEWGNPIRPADFHNPLLAFKTGSRPRDIVRVLRTGIRGTPMPAVVLGEKLDWADLWCVAEFVREFPNGGNGKP